MSDIYIRKFFTVFELDSDFIFMKLVGLYGKCVVEVVDRGLRTVVM